MMKRFNNFVKLLLVFVLSAVCILSGTACAPKGTDLSGLDPDIAIGAETVDNSPNTIEISIYNAGYGVEWLNRCAKEFMKLNSNYKIKARVLGNNSVTNQLKAGASNNSVDLFIIGGNLNSLISQGSKVVAGYDVALASLDDVYSSTVAGESVTVESKMYDSVCQTLKCEVEIGENVEEHYYSMPWGTGYSGIMYNKALFEDAGLYTEPRTTDELIEYCEVLKDDGTVPFICSAADDYFEYVSMVWWAQYEGQKGIDNFYAGKIHDTADPDANTSIEIFKQEGLREMFKVYEDLLHPDKGYLFEFSETYNYTRAQKFFLTGQKAYGAMIPNGTWLENEMANTTTTATIDNIRPMRTPIMSALSDKMSYWGEEKNFTEMTKDASFSTKRAEYDAKLRALVDYVDGVAAKPAWATDNDVKIMTEARAYMAGGAGATMSIPVYATATTAAKEFLKFMATDTAIEIYLEATRGSILPFDYDVTGWSKYDTLSEFAKQKFAIMDKSVSVKGEDSYPMYYISALRYDRGLKDYNFTITFGSIENRSSIKTADQCIEDAYNAYKNIMGKMLQDSGLL